MVRRIVFLDNNIWNMLVDPTGRVDVANVCSASQVGVIEVVGTLELFVEIMATSERRPEKYESMRALWEDLVGHRILLDYSSRHRAEALQDGVMEGLGRYLPEERIEALRQQSRNASVYKHVAEMNCQGKDIYKLQDDTVKAEILATIKSAGLSPGVLPSDIGAEDIRQLVVAVLAEGPKHGLEALPEIEVSYSRVPSLWLFVALHLARLIRTARESTSVKASDNSDRLHAAAGAYFDVFVSNDCEFRKTLALVPDLPFKVMTPAEFSSDLVMWLSLVGGAAIASPETNNGMLSDTSGPTS
jgi:hypothetical protein